MGSVHDRGKPRQTPGPGQLSREEMAEIREYVAGMRAWEARVKAARQKAQADARKIIETASQQPDPAAYIRRRRMVFEDIARDLREADLKKVEAVQEMRRARAIVDVLSLIPKDPISGTALDLVSLWMESEEERI